MKRVFADTSYFIAVIAPNDVAHERALALANQPPHLVTTTWVMVELSAYLDALTTTFSVFNSTDSLHSLAAAVYKATCDSYTFSVNAYANAAHCAMTSALEGNLQAAKNDFELSLLEDGAANASEADAIIRRTKAAVFKAKSAHDANNAKALEQKAKAAEAKAADARAEAALAAHPSVDSQERPSS